MRAPFHIKFANVHHCLQSATPLRVWPNKEPEGEKAAVREVEVWHEELRELSLPRDNMPRSTLSSSAVSDKSTLTLIASGDGRDRVLVMRLMCMCWTTKWLDKAVTAHSLPQRAHYCRKGRRSAVFPHGSRCRTVGSTPGRWQRPVPAMCRGARSLTQGPFAHLSGTKHGRIVMTDTNTQHHLHHSSTNTKWTTRTTNTTHTGRWQTSFKHVWFKRLLHHLDGPLSNSLSPSLSRF